MAAPQFVDIPQRIVLSIDEVVAMFPSRLRFMLGEVMRQQVADRAVARCAARDARRAALAAATQRAEADEAAAEADRLASDGRRCKKQ